MAAVFEELVLSEAEIELMTTYRRPSFQVRALKKLGIKAELLRNNTVRVLRRDVEYPTAPPAEGSGPKLKSSKQK